MPQDEGIHIYDLPEQPPAEGEPERLSFVELCYGVIFQPKATFRKISAHPPLLYSFFVVLIVGTLLNLVNIYVSMPAALQQMSQNGEVPKELLTFLGYLSAPGVVVIAILGGVFFALLGWFLNSAILHLIAEMYGGQGKAVGVLAVLGFSRLPNIFLIPVTTLIYLVNGPQAINSLISVILFIYTGIFLPVLGISEVHRFSYGRGIATVLTPLALFLVGCVILGILLVALVGILAPLFPGMS